MDEISLIAMMKISRMNALKYGLKLEIKGLRLPDEPSYHDLIKKEFGLKGNEEEVLEQFELILKEIEDLGGKV